MRFVMDSTPPSTIAAMSDAIKHAGLIKVNFGKHSHKFKCGSRPEDVLNYIAKMFPPWGCLMHVDEDDLVVLSQEEVLSQPTYSYIQLGAEGEADGSSVVVSLQAHNERELISSMRS